MLKAKKLLSMVMVIVVVLSLGCVCVCAKDSTETGEENSPLQFVVLDDDGNEVEVIDAEYIPEVAEMYENMSKLRWNTNTYYNLANGPLTISGRSASVVHSGYYFNANSSGRLYYYGDVSGDPAQLNIFDVTNNKYAGSFRFGNDGDGTYSIKGYIPGLSSASNRYYSVGINSTGSGAFSTYYVAVSWSSL